jgi:hypothetical protein
MHPNHKIKIPKVKKIVKAKKSPVKNKTALVKAIAKAKAD